MNNKKLREPFVVIVAGVAYCLAILYDRNIFTAFILIGTHDLESQMNTILQVQASIVTLGIALVSLLSGLSKDTVFGVSISQYIMEKKPLIFTHKLIILLELFLIILSYITVLFNYYNTLVVNFILSIIFIGLMVTDIFGIFYGSQYIRDEIREYCLVLFKGDTVKIQAMQDMYNCIYEDIRFSIEINNYMRLNNNLSLLESIFKEIINDEVKYKDQKFLLWEEHYTNICRSLFEWSKADISFFTLESICRILKINKDKNISLHFWDNVERSFLTEINNINCVELEKNRVIDCLHINLYYNLFFSENKQKNNIYLDRFSTNIYYCYLKNNKCIDPEIQLNLKKRLFKDIDMCIDYIFKKDDMRRKVAYRELINYTKVLIDNNEFAIFKGFYEDKLNQNKWPEDDVQYIFQITIYIYYLAFKEELALNTQKECAKNMLESLKTHMSHFMILSRYNSEWLNETFIAQVAGSINSWEIIPEKQAKWCFFDSIVNEFFLFYILANRFSTMDELLNKLSLLIKDNHFTFYNSFVGKNKEKTIRDYENFLSLFYERSNGHEESIQTINIFENALIKIYKLNEITKIEQDEPSDAELEKFVSDLKNPLVSELKNKIKIFNHQNNNTSIFNKEILRIQIFTALIDQEDSYIQESIKLKFFYVLVHLIHRQITLEDVYYDDKELLRKFFEQINTTKITLDTLMGYRDWFYGIEGQENFQEIESKMNIVKFNGINNLILAIDSKSLFLNLIDIDIKVDKLTESEMLDGLELNEEGKYLYNITNDIILPFTKDELMAYLSRARRIVKVKLNLEYGFKGTHCGVGVNIVQKNE